MLTNPIAICFEVKLNRRVSNDMYDGAGGERKTSLLNTKKIPAILKAIESRYNTLGSRMVNCRYETFLVNQGDDIANLSSLLPFAF